MAFWTTARLRYWLLYSLVVLFISSRRVDSPPSCIAITPLLAVIIHAVVEGEGLLIHKVSLVFRIFNMFLRSIYVHQLWIPHHQCDL